VFEYIAPTIAHYFDIEDGRNLSKALGGNVSNRGKENKDRVLKKYYTQSSADLEIKSSKKIPDETTFAGVKELLRDSELSNQGPDDRTLASVRGLFKNSKLSSQIADDEILVSIRELFEDIEQPQQAPVAGEVPSLTLDTHTKLPYEEGPVMASSPASDATNEETDAQPITVQQQPEVPPHNPATPSKNHHNKSQEDTKKVQFDEPKQNPQADPQKPESNSKYYMIGGAAVGLVIGLAVAYFAGAAALTQVLAAVAVFIAATVIGAALGAGMVYGVSKCSDNPSVETFNPQQEVGAHVS
jgi:hypothetical protein